MKKTISILFSGMLLFSAAACAKAPTEEGAALGGGVQEKALNGKKVLVAYYSYSGNTRAVAEQIAKATGGDLFEIQTAVAYPSVYNELTAQAKKEIQAGFKPELKGKVADMAQYDIVFIGSPNWWGTYAPAVSAFLAGHNFEGKTVAPFFTHGGGGMQNCEADIKKQLSGVNITEAVTFSGRSSGAPAKALAQWLGKIEAAEKIEK